MGTPCLKSVNFRCPALLELAAKAPHCMNSACSAKNFGQVVACHSNRQRHGKGLGLKAHDLPAYLCAYCHDLLDGRRAGLSQAEKDQLFFESLYASFLWLLREGHLKVVR